MSDLLGQDGMLKSLIEHEGYEAGRRYLELINSPGYILECKVCGNTDAKEFWVWYKSHRVTKKYPYHRDKWKCRICGAEQVRG